MRQEPALLLTKVDVARREVDAAIRLIFNGGDPVAIHLLASAAWEVLGALLEGAGNGSSRAEAVASLQRLTGEHTSEANKQINYNYNFIKHADRDADSVLWQLRPEQSIQVIRGCVSDFYALVGRVTIPMHVFCLWHFGQYPEEAASDASSDYRVAVEEELGPIGPGGDRRRLRKAKALLEALEDPKDPVADVRWLLAQLSSTPLVPTENGDNE